MARGIDQKEIGHTGSHVLCQHPVTFPVGVESSVGDMHIHQIRPVRCHPVYNRHREELFGIAACCRLEFRLGARHGLFPRQCVTRKGLAVVLLALQQSGANGSTGLTRIIYMCV